MRNPPRPLSAARSAGGFTLVELLVVIGIIAILAGVALGPISSGLRQAKESAAMQTCRTLALAEFQYMTDNQNYPDGGSIDTLIKELTGGNYVTDPAVFRIPGDNNATAPDSAAAIGKANDSYDFMGATDTAGTTGAGISASAPDLLPVVWSPSAAVTGATITSDGGYAASKSQGGYFGSDGVAIGYKSNNAFFRTPGKATGPTQTWPGQDKLLIIDKGVDMTPSTYGEQAWVPYTGNDGI